MDASEAQKRAAAEEGVRRIESGMIVGLGTGSTARYAIEALGLRVRTGSLESIVCVSTSEDTTRRARAAGLTLSDLATHPMLDLALDGADEVDPALDLIKGMGGAMLREKHVARAARTFVVFVDESKRVRRLGTRSPVPVEAAAPDVAELTTWLEGLGARCVARQGGAFRTDNGNAVVDCHFEGGIPDPGRLAEALDREPRVAAHGLFLGMATEVLVGTPRGIDVLRRERR